MVWRGWTEFGLMGVGGGGGLGQMGQTHGLIEHSFCGPLGGATYYHNWPQEVFED